MILPRFATTSFFSLFYLTTPYTFAQTSIAAENIIDTVAFSYIDATGTEQKEDITVVRDERVEDQWFYIPSRPVLLTKQVGGKTLPEFSLISYDYQDPPGSGNISRAGVLNFSARLSLPPEAIESMKKAVKDVIAQRLGSNVAEHIRIAALPINSATVSVYSDDGKLIGAAEGTGTAPTFASQTMAFSIQLTQLGTAVFNDMVKKTTGVRTAIQFTYNGMTPKCGYKVTSDYQQARDFYSKNEKIAARASYFGLFGGSYSHETMDIRDALVNAGALKIEMLASNECSQERLDTLMVPVLKRINDQVLETFKPPEHIDPLNAGTPSTGGYFGGAGYSVAVKSVSELRKQQETVSFEQSMIVERTTVAQGFIGIGSYPEEIQKKLVSVVDGVTNPGIYLSFPDVPQGVDRVDLSIQLRARSEDFSNGQYQYLRSTNTWKNIQTDRSADRISFSLAGIEDKYGKAGLKDVELGITKTLSTPQDSVTITSAVKTEQGSATLQVKDELLGVRLSPSDIVFQKMGGDVVRVQVQAKSGKKSRAYTFQALNANGIWQAPADEYFFAPDAEEPIELTVKATRINGATDRHILTLNADGMHDVSLDDILRSL
ncbi:hypothetical protein [Klebsiella variicola]|uniref:hypothetical protein n=1 Tax=Klebsiella variicola TaxID=244366 RepID=UPI00103304C4|nr:hypothetical protein [Klebsiella variicola]MXH35708.1 hypothetical protein [Klebsiella variicola]VAU33929.1 Uncharacterised protein [Klebsiella variicola]